MQEVIRLENVKVKQKANDWKEAIQIAGSPLVSCGSIKKKYIESMIQSVIDLGPYIVIMPHFALAHAAPCKEVIHSDISIATFEKGVNFSSDNDPVKVVMCLACVDRSSHLEKLQVIAEKMMDETMVDTMCECKTEEDLYNLLNN